MISQSRWDWVVKEIENVVNESMFVYEDTLLTKAELDLVINVLKSNTPFQVVPDCCIGNNQKGSNNNQQVSNHNVVLETKNFSVLGDKE